MYNDALFRRREYPNVCHLENEGGILECFHRLEFDAYRSDLEELSLGPRDAAAMVRIEMAQHDYQIHRDKYERLRSDVTIKLKFLEENKVCKNKI